MISLKRYTVDSNPNATYFDQLPGEMQCVVADFLNMIAELNDNTDQLAINEDLEEVECRSRSGFIPHSWNKGGLQLNATSTLYAFFCGNIRLEGKAGAAVQKMIDYSLDAARETFIENHADLMTEHKLTAEDISYSGLDAKGLPRSAEEFDEYERENLDSDYESTLHQVRIMYNGEGGWSVDVMHRISDAPYHRECDQCTEFTFIARDVDSLINNLAKIEAKVIKAFI